MSQKKYWKSLDELHNTEAYQKSAQDEFKESLPFEEDESLLGASASRRDFLKYLGFSTAAVALAASCKTKVRHAIPYAIKPDNITPGVAKYFATTYVDGAEVMPIVVKSRDGRPIKVEGNKTSKITQGATSARVQASVLNLYDTNRLRFPLMGGIDGDEASWQKIDAAVKQALAGRTALVTNSISGTHNKQVLSNFLASTGAEHIILDHTSYNGILDANETAGKRQIPYYRFDNAKTIVSIGADFLGTWVAPAIFAKQYSKGRKISAANPSMSKHIQIEGMMSMTGSNADERYTCRASEYGKVALALLDSLNGGVPNLGSENLNKGIVKATEELRKGQGLVVCGSNDAATQAVVNAINSAIGAYGTTIDSSRGFSYQGSDAKVQNFIQNIGSYDTVIFVDVNPAYRYGEALNKGLAQVKNSIAIADRPDETTMQCKTIIPLSHFLESWGDAETVSGQTSLMQPLIAPIFRSRTWQDCLLKWSGSTEDHATSFKNYYYGQNGGVTGFNKILQDGVIESAELTPAGGGSTAGLDAARTTIAATKSGKYDIVKYQKVSLGHGGQWSNNPWIQEMPDPITRVVWDNYLMMSPKTAKAHNAELTDINEVNPEKRVVNVKTAKGELNLPVMVVPGMHDQVVAIAEGYGRTKSVGKAAADLGANAFDLFADGKDLAAAELATTPEKYKLAQVQTHMSYEARPIIKEFTLADFRKEPMALRQERYELLKPFIYEKPETSHGDGHGDDHAAEGHDQEHDGGHESGHHGLHHPNKNVTIENFEEKFRNKGTLYPAEMGETPGAKWEMSIDLNSCIGCGACTIACQSENNVSVVGREQVSLMHDMEWIRIDRYFSGNPDDADSIETVYQPMLCQHCDNAPCENVCPVNATNHSTEGLNQMAYNRCIGTRYCANNCPYKVRRFNWRDWNGGDSFKSNLFTDGRRDEINDELTRMVLNPDVTVRSRGVMEKCSFCVQRLQEGKLNAKKENRPIVDADVQTACQQGCPTDAIVFGNINDPQSAISQLRNKEQKERVYYALEDIHVLPSINYLSKIRNTDKLAGGALGPDYDVDHSGPEHIDHEETGNTE